MLIAAISLASASLPAFTPGVPVSPASFQGFGL